MADKKVVLRFGTGINSRSGYADPDKRNPKLITKKRCEGGMKFVVTDFVQRQLDEGVFVLYEKKAPSKKKDEGSEKKPDPKKPQTGEKK